MLQFDERAHREDRGGGAPVVHAEGRQLETLGSLAPGIGDPAGRLQAEQEVAVDQGGRHSLALRDDASGGIDEDRLRDVLAGVGPDPLHALGGRFLERVRQTPKKRGTGGTGPGRFLGEVQVGVVAAVVIGLAAVFAGEQCRLAVRVRRRRRDPHPVVGGPAMAAEDERKKRLVRFAGLGRLLGNLQVAVRLGFERRPDRIAPGQELMQPEGEEGKATGFASVDAGTLEEPTAKHLGATSRRGVRQPRGRPRRWCSSAALRYGSSRSGVRDPCVRQRRWCSGAALRYGSPRPGVRGPRVCQRR